MVVDTALRVVVSPQFSKLLHQVRRRSCGTSTARPRSGLSCSPPRSTPHGDLRARAHAHPRRRLRPRCERPRRAVHRLHRHFHGGKYSLTAHHERPLGVGGNQQGRVLTLNVVGNIIFIPRGGMVAAAIVWAVCMVLDAAMATVQVSRFIGVTPKLSEVVKPILVVGVSAVIPGGCIAWWLGRDSFVATSWVLPSQSSLFACVCWAFRDRLHLSGLGSLARRSSGLTMGA